MHNMRQLLQDIGNFSNDLDVTELERRQYKVSLTESEQVIVRSGAAKEAKSALKKVLALESPTSNRHKKILAAIQTMNTLIVKESRLNIITEELD